MLQDLLAQLAASQATDQPLAELGYLQPNATVSGAPCKPGEEQGKDLYYASKSNRVFIDRWCSGSLSD